MKTTKRKVYKKITLDNGTILEITEEETASIPVEEFDFSQFGFSKEDKRK